MTECAHPQAEATANIERVDDLFMLTVSARCAVCGRPFEFVGQRGVAFDQPMVELGPLGALALTAPAIPAAGGLA